MKIQILPGDEQEGGKKKINVNFTREKILQARLPWLEI
jgi:hypothetical protein